MPYMISGQLTDLGVPAPRPVIALKGDHTNDPELGSFISRNMSGHDGNYVLGVGGYLQQVIVVGLDVDAAPRSQPDALDWKTPVLIGDQLTEVMADSPLGFWRLFETAGAIAADSSGNNKAGSYIGALNGQPSITGSGEGYSAQFFNNAVSRINTPTVMPLTSNPDLTFECWYQTPIGARQMNLWDRQDIGSPTRRFSVQLNRRGPNYEAGYLTVFFQGPSADVRYIVTTNHNSRLTDGVPHHIAVTKVGSVVSVYFDGAWQEVLGSVDIPGPFHNGSSHYIGASAGFLAGSKFEGYISNVAFYDVGLAEERIREHFASSF